MGYGTRATPGVSVRRDLTAGAAIGTTGSDRDNVVCRASDQSRPSGERR